MDLQSKCGASGRSVCPGFELKQTNGTNGNRCHSELPKLQTWIDRLHCDARFRPTSEEVGKFLREVIADSVQLDQLLLADGIILPGASASKKDGCGTSLDPKSSLDS